MAQNAERKNEDGRIYWLKPKRTSFLFLAGGTAALLLFKPIGLKVVAGLFVAVALLSLIAVKNRPLIKIEETGVLLYDRDPSKDGKRLAWEEIEEYGYEPGPHNTTVFVITTGDSQYTIPSTDYRILREFIKKIPDAERNKKAQKEREERKAQRKARSAKK